MLYISIVDIQKQIDVNWSDQQVLKYIMINEQLRVVVKNQQFHFFCFFKDVPFSNHSVLPPLRVLPGQPSPGLPEHAASHRKTRIWVSRFYHILPRFTTSYHVLPRFTTYLFTLRLVYNMYHSFSKTFLALSGRHLN